VSGKLFSYCLTKGVLTNSCHLDSWVKNDKYFVAPRMLEKFKNDVEKQQAEQMTDWQTKLVMMDSKERQYILQVSNYKVILIPKQICVDICQFLFSKEDILVSNELSITCISGRLVCGCTTKP
jgi:hypothetical protein